jgi:signal transduction histidine kinase/CheY-like chemotaxis protein
MWYTLRPSREDNADFVSSVDELLRPTFRNLVLATGGTYLVWALLATEGLPVELILGFIPVTVLVVVTCALSLLLLSKWFLMAELVWQVGFTVAITIAVRLSQRPEVAFLYVVLPLVAVVTVGWRAGVLAEGVVIALVGWMVRSSMIPRLSLPYGLAIIAGGAFTGLLGWTTARTLLTAIQWYLFSFAQAEEKMEEARKHRAEAVRLLKELDQAYHRLERANHMLVLARAEAEEAREARNRFALAVSHELRTPLNFIVGFSELMVNSPATYADLNQWPHGLYEDVREIYRSSTHLLRLIDDVLDLGQIEAMRMVLMKEWVDPTQIVEEVEAMVRPAFARRGLSFWAEIEPDLPDVFVDHTRIRQILLNLVSNSLRFAEQGDVIVRLQRDEGRLQFCVEDTGPGIAEEDISKVFEEFQQIGSSGWRRREGFGLGIPISQRFVELHGGRMWVESQIGEGTRFYFTLPLPETVRSLSSSLQELEEGTLDARYWRYLKERAESERTLLVLSSDPAAGEVIARYVEDYGVVAVDSPEQVPPQMINLLPCALILDCTWTQKGEVRSMLDELPYDLPVISFAFPGSPGRPRYLPDGVSNYLVKPIGRQCLVRSVQALGPDVRHLLVVDDDPGMVRFVTRVFKSAEGAAFQDGYQLTTALTGGEALAQLREDRPDALLLDLALPDISGWEVLEELQQDPDLDQLPVILITAHDWPQMSAAEERYALQVTMRHPFSRRELASALKCLLNTVRPAYPTVPAELARPAGPPA